jgi:hypothetical protein
LLAAGTRGAQLNQPVGRPASGNSAEWVSVHSHFADTPSEFLQFIATEYIPPGHWCSCFVKRRSRSSISATWVYQCSAQSAKSSHESGHEFCKYSRNSLSFFLRPLQFSGRSSIPPGWSCFINHESQESF